MKDKLIKAEKIIINFHMKNFYFNTDLIDNVISYLVRVVQLRDEYYQININYYAF